MVSPTQTTTPAIQAPTAVDDIPADWPALWQQMLQLRASGHAGAPLRWCAQQGWLLADEGSARRADLFQLYKPLLDARQAPGAAPWLVAGYGAVLATALAGLAYLMAMRRRWPEPDETANSKVLSVCARPCLTPPCATKPCSAMPAKRSIRSAPS